MTAETRTCSLQTADALLTRHCDAAARAAAEESGWAGGLWDRLDEAGFTRLGVPEAAGGSGGDCADALTLLQAAGRHAVPLPLAESSVLGGWLLAAAGLELPGRAAERARPPPGRRAGGQRRAGHRAAGPGPVGRPGRRGGGPGPVAGRDPGGGAGPRPGDRHARPATWPASPATAWSSTVPPWPPAGWRRRRRAPRSGWPCAGRCRAPPCWPARAPGRPA